MNTYGYALQNPISYYDPDGRVTNLAIGCAIGASITIVSSGFDDFPLIALNCAVGSLGLIGRNPATRGGILARIQAGLSSSAATGLANAPNVMAEPAPVPPPNYGSLAPTDKETQRQFCLINPDAPNCQDDEPDECQ